MPEGDKLKKLDIQEKDTSKKEKERRLNKARAEAQRTDALRKENQQLELKAIKQKLQVQGLSDEEFFTAMGHRLYRAAKKAAEASDSDSSDASGEIELSDASGEIELTASDSGLSHQQIVTFLKYVCEKYREKGNSKEKVNISRHNIGNTIKQHPFEEDELHRAQNLVWSIYPEKAPRINNVLSKTYSIKGREKVEKWNVDNAPKLKRQVSQQVAKMLLDTNTAIEQYEQTQEATKSAKEVASPTPPYGLRRPKKRKVRFSDDSEEA